METFFLAASLDFFHSWEKSWHDFFPFVLFLFNLSLPLKTEITFLKLGKASPTDFLLILSVSLFRLDFYMQLYKLIYTKY